ncbi:putative heterokaryon incompatibility protein [Cercophora scortea]|uniref:Heterokaryon incompatibility protein n=1 Tax=Cercophora scortea TaxID=314031 RepID=A0AAE0ILK4_9PEZI|nr:putative heterokaryon incompatibility protein [Cercophora scortea]
MSTTATYTVTMAELRAAETQHGGSSLWSNYGNPVQMSSRYNNQDPSGSGPPATSSHLVRPRSRQHTMDYPQYHHARPSQEEGDAYERFPHPSLMNIPSITSLKRSYSQVDQAPYTEMVQDLRDDYKPAVNQDQKLLSFKKVGDKHTIVDQKGRIHDMEIDAQLHGMFFLSEFPASTGDGNVLNAELTCYRRNLFQISGSLCFPQIPLSVMLETGETSQIKDMEVSISAIESVDGHPVRLIVIPWKTPPPNSPELSQGPDQEPPPLPLIPWSEESEETGGDHYAIYPIGWRRLQFRIATANNGRRKELQQHFVLHLKLHATLANGTKLVLSELTTAPIVVRGRSPRNFQARKEIPLLGSSAGSRGQTLVETGHGIVAQAVILNKPPYDSRPRVSSMELPRTAFTFTAPKQMPPSPMQMRSNSYPTTWNPSSQVSMPHNPGSASYPTTAEPYPKMPLSGAPGFTAEPQEMPGQQTSMPSVQLSLVAQEQQQQQQQQQQPPIRTQYASYVQGTSAPPHLSLSTTADSSLNVPRYVDSNPRPSKSPRHASHQSVHSTSSISNDTASNEYRYGPPSYGGVNSNSSEISPQSQHPPSATYGTPSQDNTSAPSSASANPPAPPRDYFPSSQSWTTTAGESSAPAYTNGGDRPYAYPSIKSEAPHSHQQHHQQQQQHSQQQQQQQHSQQPPPHSGAAPSGVYGGVGHYAWNAT